MVPVVGHLPWLMAAKRSLHEHLAGLARAHGPIMFLRLGREAAAVISSPAIAREALRTHDAIYANRPPFGSSKHLGGPDGHRSVTLLPLGDEWR
jgi:flavonoid 3'-monooxygenase